MSVTTSYAGGQLKVVAGRVTAIDVGAKVIGVLGDPAGGNVTVNPDGTLALVLPDPGQRGTTNFGVVLEGGAQMTVNLRVEGGPISGGWGPGEYYTLEAGDDDLSIVEPGENHRKVYVSESATALSLADIAAREGLRVDAIDGEWLAANPEYGASEGMALDTEAGMALWSEITGVGTEPSSDWLLFERGYEYKGTGRLFDRGTRGESEIHPIRAAAWGEGERPVIADGWKLTQERPENIVVQGLDFANSGSLLTGENLLLEDVVLRGESTLFRNLEAVTLRNAEILDVATGTPSNGVFAYGSDGILIEGLLVDRSGWEEGWEDGTGNRPDAFSHNIYIQWNNTDVTFRDNVSMRGSSFGAQIRSGGVIENNAFLDNNIALNIKGGNDPSGNYVGNYTLALDNVVSSGAHKEAPKVGALSWGIQNLAPETSLIGNIIAHLADPADPEERREKTEAPKEPLKNKFDPFVDDTIIYNWITDDKRDNYRFEGYANVPNIAAALLDEVTLRRFIEAQTNGRDPGDVISTLADWLRENWFDDADTREIVDFFQEGFGNDRDARTAPQTLRFVPDARGDGMRWDNRLNWEPNEDLPIDGDSVDLGGNWVTYSGTTRLAALDLGAGGVLTVRQGRLDVADLEAGADAAVAIGRSGQFWTDGYAGDQVLEIGVEAGRFANTGAFTGPVDLAVSGGEVILATGGARFALDGRLAIEGSAAKVGFDGQGGAAAVLSLMPGAELFFAPDAGGASAIREFRSGAWGTATTNVASTIDLGGGATTLSLDLNAVKSGGSLRMTLASADTLLGGFGTIDVTGAGKTAVTVRIDYAADRLEVLTGSGTPGSPTLLLSGSAADDVFVVADGVEAQVEDYGGQDSIDLSAVLQVADLGGLNLVGVSARLTRLVDADGEVLAEVEGDLVDRVWVRADGWEVRVDADGAGSPRKVPGGVVDPGPEPEPEPEPEPQPQNAAPVAADGQLRGAADAVLAGSLSATDADGDDLTFKLAGGPGIGRVRLSADGNFTYNPRGAFKELPVGETRVEKFDFTVSDGQGGTDRGTFTMRLEGQFDPTPAEPSWNTITGTAGLDVIKGTSGADMIRSGSGGYDRLWGGGDGDAFVFGAGTRDGTRSSDQIFDFAADEDILVLEAGAEIAKVEVHRGTLWVTLAGGDSDVILIDGVDADALQIVYDDGIWLG